MSSKAKRQKSDLAQKGAVGEPQGLVPTEVIQSRILLIRKRKVMLDKDLAELYGVATRQLVRQVRRNIERFPGDFMLQLTREELNNLKCQFGTSSWGGTRKLPVAFTLQPEGHGLQSVDEWPSGRISPHGRKEFGATG